MTGYIVVRHAGRVYVAKPDENGEFAVTATLEPRQGGTYEQAVNTARSIVASMNSAGGQ